MPHLPGHHSKESKESKDAASVDASDSASTLPPASQATWGAFIKSLAGMSGDLSSMTAPPWILSPISLTEFPAYWGERPDTFAAIASGRTPEERARLVVAWFISTLKGQYTSRNEKMGSEKKPLNPILGETFFGHWPDVNGRGETLLAVEQVSHHPPITAYYMENKSKGISLEGASGQKTSFSFPAIIVKQNGHAIVKVELGGGKTESYLVTLPRLRIDGLVSGSPYMETTDTSYIQSSTGYLATISYSGKGYISGKSHTVKATLTDASGAKVETFEGQWDKQTKVGKTSEVFTDTTTPKEEVSTAPIEKQDTWESRKLWAEVADNIRAANYEKASQYKSKLEIEQRQRRQDHIDAGTQHQLKFFTHLPSDGAYQQLAAQFKHSPAEEEGWVFNGTFPDNVRP